MQCIKCGSDMILDDKDFRFKGNYDNYWICPHCTFGCFEEVRFGQSFRETWTDGDSPVAPLVIKKRIEVKRC